MLKNYIKIAWRNLIKNKGFSMINIGGLAIGITAYLLITQYVKYESGYDQHLSRIDDLYRVTLTSNLGGDGFVTAAANHPAASPAMKRDFPEVESFARIVDKTIMAGNFVLSFTNEQGDKVISNVNDDKLYIADSSIIDLFNISITKGNPKTALKEPMSIIISENVAQRFFGNQDPINKNLMINNQMPMKVTGVFEDLPENTHLKFNMLVSFSTLEQWTNESWIWPEFYNYVRLKPGTDPALIEAKFPAFVKKYLNVIMEEHGFEAKFGLQPVKDIHLKSHLANEITANASEKTLNFLKIIALFVILIALINFINLSTAKSTERAMEVGIRKVVGIQKGALLAQFLFESLIINLMAAIIAITLVSLIMPSFNVLVGLPVLSMDLWYQWQIWIQLLAIVIVGGLLAGVYPAFVLSSFKPIDVLKGKFHQSEKGSLMRKSLVIAQFTISIALISGTFIIHSQFSFMQNQELGYDAEHSLIVNAPMVVDSTINNKMEAFKGELLRNPSVNSVTMSDDIPGAKIPWYNMARQIHHKKEEGVTCFQLVVDHDFIDTYKIKLLAGRNFRLEDRTVYFSKDEIAESHRVMINKTAAQSLGFANPEDAVNKKIIFKLGPDDIPAEVIGVMDNYHQQSLQNDVEPIMFMYRNNYNARYLTINMNTSDINNTISDIEKKYGAFFPHDPFKSFFLDDHFNRQYQADIKFGDIFLLFAGLAIFIAALGLFGLGSYMALKKRGELCVRRVMGADTMQVLVIIPKSLLKLVVISGLIAIPLTYFLASAWLSDYAFKIAMNPWMFIAPFLLVILVAALSVLPESIKVAFVNPARFLRNE